MNPTTTHIYDRDVVSSVPLLITSAALGGCVGGAVGAAAGLMRYGFLHGRKVCKRLNAANAIGSIFFHICLASLHVTCAGSVGLVVGGAVGGAAGFHTIGHKSSPEGARVIVN